MPVLVNKKGRLLLEQEDMVSPAQTETDAFRLDEKTRLECSLQVHVLRFFHVYAHNCIKVFMRLQNVYRNVELPQ